MTRGLFVTALALASVGFAWRSSQPKPEPYRVAFDLTSRDSLDEKAVLRWIREVSTASPEAEHDRLTLRFIRAVVLLPRVRKIAADGGTNVVATVTRHQRT